MTNTRNDLRQGTLWKQILFFSLPIAATSMLQQLFNSADVAVVGRFSAQKDLALAAVGSTSSVVNLFITIITGLAVGANVVIARSIGASDEKRAKQAVHTALILSLLCGAILLVLGECIALPLLEIMDTPSDIIGLAGKYLRIYMLGVFFQTIYNFEASILRANGDTRRPLFCLIFSGAVNVVLNLVFVIGFQLDVAGVAIATVLADVVGAGMLFHYLRRETGPVHVELSQLKLDRKLAGAILYTGIPAAVQGMMFNIANVIIQTGFNRLGSQVVAASTIGVTAEIFVYYLVNSFGQASMTFTGQNYGAGNYERIRKGYRLTLGIAGSIGLGAGILFFVLNHEIFGLFVNEPEAIEAGGNYLKILALSQLFMVTESVTAGAFNGTGHTTPPALTGIIFTGARIPMAYFLTSFPQLGLTGIWWSITISSILKGSVLPLWFLHFQRKLK